MRIKKNVKVNIDYINPFLSGANKVFNELLKVDLKKGKVSVVEEPRPMHDVLIKIGVQGKANGYVLYSLGFNTVSKIADVLSPGISEKALKSEYKDIIGEFANMITGNALGHLSKKGIDISTPVIMHKDDMDDSEWSKRTVFVLKQYSPYGQLETTIVLKPAA